MESRAHCNNAQRHCNDVHRQVKDSPARKLWLSVVSLPGTGGRAGELFEAGGLIRKAAHGKPDIPIRFSITAYCVTGNITVPGTLGLGVGPAARPWASRHRVWWCTAIVAVVLGAQTLPAAGQGIALRGVGPINESMGGVAVGCPLDATGAIHWNPASISGLPNSEMAFGIGLLLPTTQLSSRVESPITLSGSDDSEPGVSAIPTMAMVHKVAGTPWTFGVGVLGVGGSDVNYPASVLGGTNNPILFPQPLGLGRLSASVNVVQIDPTVSYQLTDRLAIGFAPTVTLADIQASPLFLGPQNQDGTYPEGIGTRYAWGGGFQVGLYYTPVADWHFGTSLKSPQWMEPFRFQTQDSLGRPQVETFHLDYPSIVSVGGSYTGFENWVLGCDVRYFNYAGTAGFGAGGFAPDGALIGFDWKDVYSVAVGVQRQLFRAVHPPHGLLLQRQPHHFRRLAIQRRLAADHPTYGPRRHLLRVRRQLALIRGLRPCF